MSVSIQYAYTLRMLNKNGRDYGEEYGEDFGEEYGRGGALQRTGKRSELAVFVDED